MNMALKVKFGTGNEARADALEVLAWVTRNWRDDLSSLTLDTEDNLEVLRLKGANMNAMEEVLGHLLAVCLPREGFEVILVAQVK